MSGRRLGKNGIPELFLEQHALGELAEVQAEALNLSELQNARAALESDNAEILQRLPADRVVPWIRSQYAMEKARAEAANRRRIQSRRVLSVALTTAAAAVPLIVLLLLRPDGGREVEDKGATRTLTSEGVRIKGSSQPFMTVYRKTGDKVEKLEDGDTAKPGDLIQLAYVARGHTHGVVLSIDGAGAVTLHWPESADSSTLLNLEGEIPLEHAYELDEAPFFERFFFVTSTNPIDVVAVRKLAQTLSQNLESAAFAQLKTPKGWTQNSILLKKVVP